MRKRVQVPQALTLADMAEAMLPDRGETVYLVRNEEWGPVIPARVDRYRRQTRHPYVRKPPIEWMEVHLSAQDGGRIERFANRRWFALKEVYPDAAHAFATIAARAEQERLLHAAESRNAAKTRDLALRASSRPRPYLGESLWDEEAMRWIAEDEQVESVA